MSDKTDDEVHAKIWHISKVEEIILFRAIEALKTVEGSPKKMPLRADADAIWRAIAAGLLNSDDTVRWAQLVAVDVVEHVINDSSQQESRPERALNAIKLNGRADDNDGEYREVCQYLSIHRAGCQIMEIAFEEPSPPQIVKFLKTIGFWKDMPGHKARNRAGRLLKRWRSQDREEASVSL